MDQTIVTNPKPYLTLTQAKELLEQLYGLVETDISNLPSYSDQNFLVADKKGKEYVLRINNSADTQSPMRLELQIHAMTFLRQQGLPTQTVLPTKTGQLMSLKEMDFGFGHQTYSVMLMIYLPGNTIAQTPVSPRVLYDVGKLVANVDKMLQQMVSPNVGVLQRDDRRWNLSNTPLVESYLSVMDGDPLQAVVKAVIEQFKTHVQPKLCSFKKGIIHGDLSDQNLLVQPADNGSHTISGILDFAELHISYFVYEVAVSIMYLMLENPTPMDVGGAVLGGYESIAPLSEAERDVLYLLVLCRFCQSLVYGRHFSLVYPENREYCLTTARNGGKLLTKLWELGKVEVERKWFQDAKTYSHY